MSRSRIVINSSFRDPSGFIFIYQKNIYRQINLSYKPYFEQLISSGLYKTLTDKSLLIKHIDVNLKRFDKKDIYKFIKPDKIPFISYPYEWSFSQLKDAALTTLTIQKIALEYGMSLKDASGYNIQFFYGKPLLIDTLSFEKYEENKPWIAYKQFCTHFLAPLLLIGYKDLRLIKLLRYYLDGIPLDLTSNLLPAKTYLNLGILSHIHLHAKSLKKYERASADKKIYKVNRTGLQGIIDSLYALVKNLKIPYSKSLWSSYYQETNYSQKGFQDKQKLVKTYLREITPKAVWDLGANTGIFSRISAGLGSFTVSIDNDPVSVDENYLQSKKTGERNILPLFIDIRNPVPALGWENKERNSLIERGPADCILSLALIHHLAIGNNLPFDHIARFFASIGNYLIIEFVPKDDSQCSKLLANREDIFSDYHQKSFEKKFKNYFIIKKSQQISDTKRTIYLMKKKVASVS